MIATALTVGPSLGAQQTPKAANIAEIVAPVVKAIEQENARQSRLPPPASVREQLERMGRLDQAGRMAIREIDFRKLSLEVGKRVNAAIGKAIQPVDEANVEALLKILPEEGWFTIAEFGEEASSAAFHIVQHSDPALRKKVLPRLERLAVTGEIDGEAYAAIFDRIATGEGRPQRFGTQYRCVDGKMAAYPLEKPEQVEGLRRSLKLRQTFTEARAMHTGKPCGGP